jgi:NADH:ubiquinone oxidoreductase subunit C
MIFENNIIKKIKNKFKIQDDKCFIKRVRRLTIEASDTNFRNIIEYILKELSFNMLCTITGLDMKENFQMIYHLADDNGIIIDLKLNVSKQNPVIETVTDIYKGAILYERELTDMFGIRINGLATGNRYPLPDWWPNDQYPLRKDWKTIDLSKTNLGGKCDG